MDPITIVVYMTGLLLLSPTTSKSQFPLHVLLPRPSEEHDAQIGFYEREGIACAAREEGICYVDLNGYSLVLPDSVAVAAGSGRVRLGDGIADVSRSRHRVSRQYLGGTPDTMLRARVTLNEGFITGSCALGTWSFRRRHMPMDNVLTWSMPNAAVGSVTLRLRALRPSPSDSMQDRDITLTPDEPGLLSIFIRHVPKARPPSPSARYAVPGDTMRHFHDLSHLLSTPQAKDTAPTFVARTGRRCQWGDRGALIPTIDKAPGTLSCMVTSALPED